MLAHSPLRVALIQALDNVCTLAEGLSPACAAITDPGQRNELLRAKAHILDAIVLEEKLPKAVEQPGRMTELMIGDVMPEGDPHAGFTYAGQDIQGNLWVAMREPDGTPGLVMNHSDAKDWAEARGGSLRHRRKASSWTWSVQSKRSSTALACLLPANFG